MYTIRNVHCQEGISGAKEAAEPETGLGRGGPIMICTESTVKTRYRIWIVRYEGAPPDCWHDVPLDAIAVEPAERGTMAVRQAGRYVETFNRAALGGARKVGLLPCR